MGDEKSQFPQWRCDICWKMIHFEEFPVHQCSTTFNLQAHVKMQITNLETNIPSKIYTPWDLYQALKSELEKFRRKYDLPDEKQTK